MRYLMKLAAALALFALAPGAGASPEQPREGVHYGTLPHVNPTESGRKIEVTEFFAYYCPHCNAFEPKLNAWAARNKANVVLRRVHVARDERVLPQQRLFYTLEAMGLLDKYHAKVYEAMHVQRLPLDRDVKVFEWAAQAGIDRDKFILAYRSFDVLERVRHAGVVMQAYYIDRWPMVAVDGRFITSPGHLGQAMPEATEAQLHDAALKVLDFLVAKARAEKK